MEDKKEGAEYTTHGAKRVGLPTEKKIEYAYIFLGEMGGDTNTFHQKLTAFKKGKVIKECIISTNAVMAGIVPDGKGGHLSNIVIVPSAYIVWETTQKEVDSFLFNLKMTGKA
jgi:hypothetical protein